MNIYVVSHVKDRGSDYEFESGDEIYFANKEKAQEFVDEHNAPLMERAKERAARLAKMHHYTYKWRGFTHWDEHYTLDEVEVLE